MSSCAPANRGILTTARLTVWQRIKASIAIMTAVSQEAAMPIEMEATMVEANVSHTDAVQPIVALAIAVIALQGKRTIKMVNTTGILS